MHQAHQYVNGGISMSLVRESPHAVPCPRRPPRRRHLLPSARFASCLQDIHTRQTQQHEALHLRAMLFSALHSTVSACAASVCGFAMYTAQR